MTWRDTKDFRDAVSPPIRDLAGRLRRMLIRLTSRAGSPSAIWQLLGHRGEDGRTETVDAEVFSGIGVFARPLGSAKAEAVVVNVGSVEQPIVIATRCEDVRKAVLDQLAENETAIYTSKAVVWIRADGTVEIRTATGTAKKVAHQEDLEALWTHVNGLATGGSGSAIIPAPAIGPGTASLKAE